MFGKVSFNFCKGSTWDCCKEPKIKELKKTEPISVPRTESELDVRVTTTYQVTHKHSNPETPQVVTPIAAAVTQCSRSATPVPAIVIVPS